MKREAEDFIVLEDAVDEDALARDKINPIFGQLVGRPFKEFLKDLIEAVQKGDRWAAITDLRAVLGDHLAECNEFYNSLNPGTAGAVPAHVEKDV